MAILFANNAFGTLSGSISAAATTINLGTGQGARFPNPTNPDYFLATLIGIDGNGNENSWEIVKVTGRTNDALTVVRGQESTTAAIWAAGTRLELRITKGSLDLFTQGVLGTDVQAYDGDLAAIAALAGTSGFLKKTAANTWSLDTNTYLTGNQSITLSGDASGSGSTAITVTLATVTAAKGGTGQTSYAVGDLLYASGTSALSKLAGVATGNALISGGVATAPSWGKIGLTTHVSGTLGVANGGTGVATLTGLVKANGTSAFSAAVAGTDYLAPAAIGSTVQAYDGDLAAIAALAGTSGFLKKTAANTWTLDTATYITGNQTITLSGDASGSGATSIAVTLANSGVGAGTYRSVTVDAKGRVTAGTNPTTLAGYGITDAAGTAANTFTANQTLQANLIFDGTSRRITGDMSNATLANRLAFQSSTTNGNTTVSIIPNGTANTVQLAGFTDSAMTNSTIGGVYVDTAEVRLFSSAIGTGSTTPITMRIGANEYFRLGTAGAFELKGGVTFSKDIKETVFTITDGASVDINPANGTIQLWTLGASRTPTASSFADGQSVTLLIDDGTAYAVTWTTIGVTWKTNGGSAPTLQTTGRTAIALWKADGTVYGARVGDA